MPVEGINGILNVESAALHAPQVGVANTNPQHILSVGSNLYVSGDSPDVLTVDGNVVCEGVKVGLIEIIPSYDLEAVANVGNSTSNTIQFTNATTSFVASSNVEIGGNITLTSNAQVKVGSNVLAEYTGPHGREPKEMPLKKFPEIAFDASKLDGNETTNVYVQAGYTVTSSTDNYHESGFFSYKLFNGIIGNEGWISESDPATVSGSPFNSISSSYVGEWVKLELPKSIKLNHFTISSRKRYQGKFQPENYKLFGSINNSTWVELAEVTGQSFPSSDATVTTNVTTSNYYKYYALVVSKTNYSVVCISEWELYGYEEPAPPGDLSLDTTLKSTFNSVRSNNYVMYFDGEDPDTGNVPKYLPSGSVKSITPNNVVFDATNNCWTLDGSTESNVTTGSLGLVGDAPHTVSTWINASNLEANATTQQLFSIGSGYSEEIVRVDDTQIAANTWHNVTYAYQGEGGSKVTYVDGRKVEESQVEDTFGEYPPFAMTDYKTGGYRVSASSEFPHATSYKAYQAFDDIVTGNNALWLSNNHYGTNGVYTGSESTTVSGTAYSGEWLQIELPHKLKVSYVAIQPQNDALERSPLNGVIAGSNDGTTWNLLDSFTGITTTSSPAWSATVPVNFTLTSSTAYKYFRLVITATQSTTTYYASIQNVQLYGHKEGDLTRFPEPTRVLKYPHIAFPNSDGPAGQGPNATTSIRGYVATSDEPNPIYYPIGKVFDGIFSDPGGNNVNNQARWQPTTAIYANGNDTTAGATTTLANGTTYKGNYMQLESPHKLNVTKYKIYSGTFLADYRPSKVVMLGSNTGGSDWVDLGSGETTLTYSGTNADYAGTVSISNTSAYKYHRLVIRAVASQSLPVVYQLEFYGTQEDTGTPAIVGGPFAGKVANFRVYDQYLGDERIQEIYDAQKDAFGHKKSSMTLYKGRVGVGTTEPEGALTVVDEPHALARFPARAVSANESYVEGDGQIKLSAADGTGYQAFDGLTSTSWAATPTRNTRLSEEVDFGAWLKIQTPESMSLKKAEFESKPDWVQVGTTINDSAEHAASTSSFGFALDCSDDGTRIIVGAYAADVGGSNRGQAFVFDWNGSNWVRVGNILQGTQDGEQLGYAVAISGDGNYIALGSPNYDTSTHDDGGRYGVFNLVGSTWTILPDAGALTSTTVGEIDYFTGAATNARAGWSLSLSHDGKTIAAGYRDLSPGGEIRVHTYTNGTWTQKGQSLLGTESSDRLGYSVKMSPDGNYLIAGAPYGAVSSVYVYDYNSSTSQWVKRTTLTHPTLPNANTHFYGSGIAISDDGNTVAVGASGDDTGGTNYGRVYMYSWSGSEWTLVSTLTNPLQGTDNEYFGTAVDLSGDGTRLVAAAAYENVEQGYAFTFEYNGGSWRLRDYTTSGSAGLPTNTGRLGEFYTGLIISRDGSTIVGGDRAGSVNSKARVWNMPSNIKSIWGSNDDVNWTKITTGNETFRGDDRLEFKNLDNPNYYKYHAIVADAFTRLKDIKLFGIRNQGSSTLHDGTLTLTKNLDVPRIGPPLDADDTPRRDRLVVEYNTSTNPLEDGMVKDTSGRGNDGVFVGTASYDTTQKAFTFPGTAGNYITRSQIGNSAGAWVHSFSLWVNTNDLSYNHIFSIGADSDNDTSTFRYDAGPGGNAFKWFFYGNDVNFTYSTAIDVWLHVVGVYDGGSVAGSRRLWVNGVESVQSSSSGIEALTLTANTQLTLGERSNRSGTQTLNGEISNFKLYDCALTAQEVKTLYDMGRCSNAIPKTLHIMGGMMRYNNDIGKLQIHNGVQWYTIGGVSATGGAVTYADGYTIHTFTSLGTFQVSSSGDVEYLIVAGGGAGGYTHGGGGGGGGVLTGTLLNLLPGSYTITVGAGGAFVIAGTGGNGSNSTALGLTAIGGGGGGRGYGPNGSGQAGTNGSSGGSGGGGGPFHVGGAGTAGPPIQGYVGGNGINDGSQAGHGGGGGGAGGVGGDGLISGAIDQGISGKGGIGLVSLISGSSSQYAGGGSGGRWAGSLAIDVAGGVGSATGGGGIGGAKSTEAYYATAGTSNTGGGGGGGGDGGGNGANGGSGIVIIRYLM
jgi:hypothetical protein